MPPLYSIPLARAGPCVQGNTQHRAQMCRKIPTVPPRSRDAWLAKRPMRPADEAASSPCALEDRHGPCARFHASPASALRGLPCGIEASSPAPCRLKAALLGACFFFFFFWVPSCAFDYRQMQTGKVINIAKSCCGAWWPLTLNLSAVSKPNRKHINPYFTL